MQDNKNIESKELQLVVEGAGLETSQVENLMKSYAGSFQEAKKVVNEFKAIVVTSVDQTDLMKKAKDGRKQLKEIRVGVEKTRISLKEQSLREGKAIDGMANIIKALIAPVEEHLEKQEKFAELKEAERIAKKHSDRIEKLSLLVADVSLYNLKDMTDEAFDNLIKQSEEAKEAKKKELEKIEADRIEWERKQKVLNDRTIELAPYKMLLVEGIEELDIDTTDEEYSKMFSDCKKAMVAHNKEQERIKKENEELKKKAEADRVAKEELEKKLKDEKEAQEKKEKEARDAEEAKKKADEERIRLEDEAKKKAILAPDKEKLLELAKNIELITMPNVASREAGDVIKGIEQDLKVIVSHLIERSRAL